MSRIGKFFNELERKNFNGYMNCCDILPCSVSKIFGSNKFQELDKSNKKNNPVI